MPSASATATDLVPASATQFELGSKLAEFAQRQLGLACSELARPRLQLHSGIHEARKALRRAQAALRLGQRAEARAMERTLRRIGRTLSPLRDAQALVEVLERHSRRAGADQSAASVAIDCARRRRDAVLDQQLQADPGLQSRRQQLALAAQGIAELDWRCCTTLGVVYAVARSEARVSAARLKLREAPADDELWHRLRRHVRRLKQQTTLLAEILPQIGAMVRQDDATASVLGEAQDEFLLAASCAEDSPFATAQRRLLRRAAQIRLQYLRGEYDRLCAPVRCAPGQTLPREESPCPAQA